MQCCHKPSIFLFLNTVSGKHNKIRHASHLFCKEIPRNKREDWGSETGRGKVHPIGFGQLDFGGSVIKNLPANTGDTGDRGSVPGLGRFPGEGNGNPLSILAWEIHGQRSPAGNSPWGCKESDMKEVAEHTCTY